MKESSRQEYVPYSLVTYSTSHLSKSDKVRFYYALKGRDGKSGIIKSCSIEQLTKTVLLVPPDQSTEVKEFLEYWKCEHQVQEVLIR
ncbi:MAG: hypothetical protein ACE5FT_04665 [Candidatus Nanoarchaeia archaeon]